MKGRSQRERSFCVLGKEISMKTSNEGIVLLKQFEGCRLIAYRLPKEKYNTIGYGHYGPDVKDGEVISELQAEAMLRMDLEKYEKLVEKYVTDIKLNHNQFDALVSYTYNRGEGGIKQLAMNCHTVEEYSLGFIKYWGSAERYKDALLKRRKKERALFDTPVAGEAAVQNETGCSPDVVIAIAEAEEGYLEKSAAAYRADPSVLDRKTAGAGSDNYTKYGRDMHAIYPQVMDFPAYWCDAFVDWCFYKAYGVATAKSLLGGNFDDYTVASARMYEKKGALDTTPSRGAQIFFTKNGRVDGCHHTGIVVKVGADYIETMEGNTSGTGGVIRNGGGVARKQYKIAAMAGKVLFGHPKYDDMSAQKEPHTPVGYQIGTGYCLAVDMNVRNRAGATDKASVVGVLKKGTWVECCGLVTINGKIWMLIPPDPSGKSSTQFVCADNGERSYIK